ncbi:MAG: ABC transporter substrate-binding protein [Armatimonadetes bacterium]|nr:ABC transporter substrate-binding protein [Anaerolineae bacterium]
MRNKMIVLIVLCFTLMLLALAPLNAQDATPAVVECPEGSPNLVIAAGAVGIELEFLNGMLEQYMALCPNVTASALEVPDLTTDRLGLYIQFLGSRSPIVDIYNIDTIWPAIVAEHMINYYDFFPADDPRYAQHFPTIIENNTIDGRLIGMPWYIDAGLLYYRTDLLEKYGLEIPQTWDELEIAAKTIQDGERAAGNAEFWGYIWQGKLGEPTTVNALEWQASNGGGRIISAEGEVQVDNPETIAAIERAAGWINTITPPQVLGHTPPDSQRMWESGNIAFMRNWAFAYKVSNEEGKATAGKFAVTVLPAGDSGERAATLGGWQLAVSKYSEFPDAAVKLVLYLTSYEGQKQIAQEINYNPTIAALYDDPDVLSATPFFIQVRDVFQNAVPRPSTVAQGRYNDISNAYAKAVSEVLNGESDARTAMEDLGFDLDDLMIEINGG